METWRTIPGTGYEASTEGRIRGPRGWILTPRKNKTGYYQFLMSLGSNEARKYMRVHRAVLLAHVGEPPTPKHHGAHRNGQRDDNRLENLAWLTPVENMADQLDHGTRVRGEKARHARMSDEQARAIWTDPRPMVEIAIALGQSYSAVRDVKRGKTRRYLEEELGPPVPSPRGYTRREGGWRTACAKAKPALWDEQ